MCFKYNLFRDYDGPFFALSLTARGFTRFGFSYRPSSWHLSVIFSCCWLLVLLYSCRWCDSRKAKAIMVEALKKYHPFFVLKCVSLEENLSIRIIGLGLKVSDTFLEYRKFFEKFFNKIKSWYNFLLRVIWRKFLISLKIDLPMG